MGFEITEHTADVGIHAWSPTLTGCFEEATAGLLDITGARDQGEGEWVSIEVEARDVAGALVDWLSEILYVQDARDALVSGLGVDEVDQGKARGWVALTPRTRDVEGTAVKAITYHALDVSQREDGWHARLIVDV